METATVFVVLCSSRGLSLVQVPVQRPATYRIYEPRRTVDGVCQPATLRLYVKADAYSYVEQER